VHGIIRRSSSFNTGRISHLFADPKVSNRPVIAQKKKKKKKKDTVWRRKAIQPSPKQSESESCAQYEKMP
jgi:hypothetical protein